MFKIRKNKPKPQENSDLFKARTAIKRQIDRLNNYRDVVTQQQQQQQPGQADTRQQLASAIFAAAKDASLGVSVSPQSPADIEVIYDVPVSKKTKHGISVKGKKEKHIALSLITSRQIALLHHYATAPKSKDGQLELLQSWLLSDLVAVDFGDSCEVVFMFDTPYSFFTNSAVERDEAVWVVLNLCEALCKFRPQTSVDSDVLGFTATANNFVAQHPVLQKYMARASMSNRAANGPDNALLLEGENEAAELLTSMSWHEHSSNELAAMLRQQQEDLQRGNIEFLLEWEELGGDGDDAARMSRLTAAAPAQFRPLRFGQTEQLLAALDSLDTELEDLDGWLETQIDHLSELQHELFRIEDENNMLETQWQNYSRLKAVVQQIVDSLFIPVEQLQLLRNPERAVDLAFQMPNFNEIPSMLQPLVDAMQRLHKGLFRTEVAGESVMASWLQLGTLAAVRDQEQQLHELRIVCCEKLGRALEASFRRILEHRALDDERTGATVKVKAFHFNEILGASPQTQSTSSLDPLTQLLTAQKLYHGVVNDFIPLIDGLVSLDMQWLPALKMAYVQTTAEHLYTPLIKQYFKDLQAQLPHLGNRATRSQATRIETLNAAMEISPRQSDASSSTPSSRPAYRTNVTLLFGSQSEMDSTISLVTAGFVSCLKHIRSLIQKEERFLSALFDTYSEQPEDPQPFIEILFGAFKKRIIRFVASDEFVEGLDLLSMLRVIDEVFRDDNTADANGRQPAARSEYLSSALLEVQVALTQRFNEFIAQQENWIVSFKADTKRGGVLPPFLKLPVLVDYVERSVDGRRIEAAVTAYQKLCNALFSSLERLSSQNIKYSDTVRIVNYDYFVQTIGSRAIPTLQRFVDQATHAKAEAQERYVRWMVQYELPQLTALMDRIEEVAESYGDASVGIYVKKDAVSAVVRSNERAMPESLGNVLQRLRKHFSIDTDPSLVDEIWKHLQRYLLTRYRRYETIVHAAYQLRVSPATTQVETLLRNLNPV